MKHTRCFIKSWHITLEYYYCVVVGGIITTIRWAFLFSHPLPLIHAPIPLPSTGPRWPPTLSHLTLLSGKRELAYPERLGPQSAGLRAGGQSPPGAAAVASDPALSSCPGSAPGTERASEMGFFVPRAALRTAHLKTWPNHSTHWILPTRLLL